MKKTVVFGAGQMGKMARLLLGTDHEVVCFADNSDKKQGSVLGDLPVISPAAAEESQGLRIHSTATSSRYLPSGSR